MGPGALAQVLRQSALSSYSHPQLLVGLQTSDDAAVFRLSETQALVQTVDFFAPVVDDPFTYGAIAAANSVSDIYAMGGDVLFALNIAAFPDDLPGSILADIFRGGAATMARAGGVIAGGHTVTDPEPKYGLCVTGTVHPDRILTKAGAQVGDRLYLTKPLGTGAITTAMKNRAASAEVAQAAIDNMLKLNRQASELARVVGVNACTDITGFGLLGHGLEIATKSGVRLEIDGGRVPLLPGAWDSAEAGHLPGGMRRNREHFTIGDGGRATVAEGVHPLIDALMFDPETSGPLLLSVIEANAGALESAFAGANAPLWKIGRVRPGSGIDLLP